MMATLLPDRPDPARFGKPRFANAAHKFANRVAALPGFAPLCLGGAAATVLATIVGAFGTIDMPIGRRLGFWAVLIGWNVAKWLAWFGWTVRRPSDWRRAAAIGTVVVNLPLPLEIPIALRLFGIDVTISPVGTWIEAATISATLFVVLLLFRARPATPPVAAADGALFRAGVRDLRDLRAITAEDHYCRLHLVDGRSALVLARFTDALAELAGVDGERIHRGAWVAASAVDGAIRDGRAWRLLLSDGTRLPVSASRVATVRARGWLRIKPPIGVA